MFVVLDASGTVVVATSATSLPGYTSVSDSDARVLAFQALQLAESTLATKIAAGIAITCTSNSALTGTYALDQNTLDQISGLVNNGFPHGNTTQAYPFQSAPPTSAFTVAQMTALRNDMRDYVFDLETQAGIMAAGGSPSWPPNTFTIA